MKDERVLVDSQCCKTFLSKTGFPNFSIFCDDNSNFTIWSYLLRIDQIMDANTTCLTSTLERDIGTTSKNNDNNFTIIAYDNHLKNQNQNQNFV